MYFTGFLLQNDDANVKMRLKMTKPMSKMHGEGMIDDLAIYPKINFLIF